jgi:hypothetical protein
MIELNSMKYVEIEIEKVCAESLKQSCHGFQLEARYHAVCSKEISRKEYKIPPTSHVTCSPLYSLQTPLSLSNQYLKPPTSAMPNFNQQLRYIIRTMGIELTGFKI